MLLDRLTYIVDDDAAVRATLRMVLTKSGIYTREFSSGEAFIEEHVELDLGCVLLDIQLPGMSGIDVLSELKRRKSGHPVIMLSGRADIPSAVRSIQAGALDFVEKPYRNARLLEALEQGFKVLRSSQIELQQHLNGREAPSLSAREKEVLMALADGWASKQIAHELGIGVRTVEMHRANITKKLEAKNSSHALTIARERGLIL